MPGGKEARGPIILGGGPIMPGGKEAGGPIIPGLGGGKGILGGPICLAGFWMFDFLFLSVFSSRDFSLFFRRYLASLYAVGGAKAGFLSSLF